MSRENTFVKSYKNLKLKPTLSVVQLHLHSKQSYGLLKYVYIEKKTRSHVFMA